LVQRRVEGQKFLDGGETFGDGRENRNEAEPLPEKCLQFDGVSAFRPNQDDEGLGMPRKRTCGRAGVLIVGGGIQRDRRPLEQGFGVFGGHGGFRRRSKATRDYSAFVLSIVGVNITVVLLGADAPHQIKPRIGSTMLPREAKSCCFALQS
jgi:hypothetical protein